MWRCCLNRGICEFVVGGGGGVEEDDVGEENYRKIKRQRVTIN